MSARLQFYVFKGCSAQRFVNVLDAVADEFRDELTRSQHPHSDAIDCRVAFSEGVHTLYLDLMNDVDFHVAREIGLRLAIPWLRLSISEGTTWEYQLHKGSVCMDKFSVCPQYWDDDLEFVAEHRGNPDLLAATWSIPKERIVGYLVNWQLRDVDEATFEFELSGKAYETDRYSYGDISQMFDFLDALGGKDPVNLEASAERHLLNRLQAAGLATGPTGRPETF